MCQHPKVSLIGATHWECTVCQQPFIPVPDGRTTFNSRTIMTPGGNVDIHALAVQVFATKSVIDHLDNGRPEGQKIHAIKETRAVFAVGLKEAKDAVELVMSWRESGYDPTPLSPEEEQRAYDSVLESIRSKET